MNEMEDLRQVAGYLVDIDEGYYARRVDKALRAWEADIQDKEIAGAAMDNLARKLTDAEARIKALERACALFIRAMEGRYDEQEGGDAGDIYAEAKALCGLEL